MDIKRCLGLYRCGQLPLPFPVCTQVQNGRAVVWPSGIIPPHRSWPGPARTGGDTKDQKDLEEMEVKWKRTMEVNAHDQTSENDQRGTQFLLKKNYKKGCIVFQCWVYLKKGASNHVYSWVLRLSVGPYCTRYWTTRHVVPLPRPPPYHTTTRMSYTNRNIF